MLWHVLNDAQISAAATAHILNPANECFISPASFWELAIKISIGKYTLTVPYTTFMQTAIQANNFRVLPIEPHHTVELLTLPFHHKDPFDRLMIVQAIVEQMPILS